MIHQKFGADWLPGFADYTYLSATNVTNFASADTTPPARRPSPSPGNAMLGHWSARHSSPAP